MPGHSQHRHSAANMITAPYNFVPLSATVVFPDSDWKTLSHDIPFSDGISGTITCELTTESPVYVRNGGNWEHDDIMRNREAQSFFKIGNQFIIPGTSLKGMLRNVLEIASFGKMNRADNRRYSVRDLHNSNLYGTHMTERVDGTYRAKPKAAWMKQDEQTRQWHLSPCEYARVEQEDLIKYHGRNPDLKSRQSAQYKYRKWDSALQINFDCTPEQDFQHSCGMLKYKKVISATIGRGPKTGTIVFTGQPARNDKTPKKKHLEFVFFDEKNERHYINEKLFEEFVFIHSDANGEPNAEWKYWKAKKRVPVFYLGDVKNPESIGLALMYRLPYKHTVHDAIRHTSREHLSEKPDLAETIFGFVRDKDCLKGRVSVSHAIVQEVNEGALIETVLGSPKPTYYPNYMEQPNPQNGYKTFMDRDCKIRGWKRYPARMENVTPIPTAPTENVKVKFVPLRTGARFTFCIKIHNLRPFEVGALMWALTWGGNKNLVHSLGMAKSLGYGQVKIKVASEELVNIKGEKITNDCIGDFTSYMSKKVRDWQNTPQIRQFLAMSNPAQQPSRTTQRDKLKHMSLSNPNKFVEAKSNKLYLKPHA